MDPTNNTLNGGNSQPAYDPSSLEKPVTAADLSTPLNPVAEYGADRPAKRWSPFRFNRQAFTITAVALAVIVFGGLGGLLLNRSSDGKKDKNQVANYSVGSVSLSGVKGGQELQLGDASHLSVNGQLKVSDTVVLSPTGVPQSPVTGQIYYDKSTNAPYYYNGTSFVSLAPQGGVTSVGGATGTLGLGSGLQVSGNTLSISSTLLQSVNSAVNTPRVSSLQGLTGDLTLTAGPGISISGTTIKNAGVLSLVSGSGTLTVTDDGNGNLTITEAGSGAGGTVALGPTSPQTDSSNNNSIDINKTGSGSLLKLAVSGVTKFEVSQTGAITAGTINYSQVQGTPVVVNSVGGLTGAVSIGSSLTVSGGSLNAIQDIRTTATPVFAGLKNGTDVFTIPTNGGSGGTLCYVSGGTSNCPSGGNASYGASHAANHLAALDASGNVIDSQLATSAGGLQYTATAAYFLDLQNTSDSTLTVKNTSPGKVANLVVTGTIQSAGLQNSAGDLFGLAASPSGTSRTLCYIDNTSTSNCTSSGGVGNFINNNTTQQTSANFNIQARSGTVAAVVQGASAQDILQIVNSLGNTTIRVDTFGNLALANALTVANGGTGATSLAANGVVLGNGSGALTAVTASSVGDCLLANGSLVPVFQACPIGGNISYLGGSGESQTVNHLLKFGAASNSVTDSLLLDNGTVVTVFGDLIVNTGSSLFADNLSSTLGGTGLTISGGANNVSFSNQGGANTFIFPTSGGTGQVICTSGITCASGGGQAVILEPSGVQSANANATAVFINKASGTGNLIQLQAGGTDAFVINSGGAASFPNASGLTLGTAGSTNGVLKFANSTNSNLVSLQSLSQSGAITLQIPTLGTPGTYDICLTSGNCAGAGGGITGSGTTNKIALFTGSGTIGDSALSQSGSDLTGTGNLTVQGGGLTLGTATTATGSIAFKNSTNINTVTLQSGITGGNLTFTLPTADGASGDCLKTNSLGVLSFGACLSGGGAGGGVTDINGASGAITLAGTTNQITVTQSPVGTFTFSTPQNIHTGASPTFAGLTVTSASGLTLGTASTATGGIVFKGSGGAGTLTLQGPTTPNPGNFTLSIPAITANASVCTTNAVCTGYAPATGGNYIVKNANDSSSAAYAGILLSLQNNDTSSSAGTLLLGNAGTSSALAVLQSSSPTAGNALIRANNTDLFPSGDLLALQNNSVNQFSVDVDGNATANGTVQAGVLNATSFIKLNGANINTAGTLTNVAYLNQANIFSAANTFTSTAAVQGGLTLGLASTTSGTLTFANSASSRTLTLQAANVTGVGNATLNIPTLAGGSTDTVCLLTLANCSGGFTGSGTSGTIAMFTGASSVGDSALTQAAGNLTASGNLTVQGGSLTVGNPGSVVGSLTLSTSAANSRTVILQGANPSGTGNATISIPSIAGGSSDTVCLLTLANCAGAGGGVTSAGGTSGRLAKFAGSTAIGNSILDESGNTITLQSGASTASILGSADLTVASAAGSTTTIGSTSGASAVTLQAGTGGINLGTGGIANTIQIGNTTGAVAQTINIGNNATASSTSTLVIGSTIGTSPVTLQSGTSGVLVKGANTTTAFQVQNASGTTIFNVDTTNSRVGTPNAAGATTALSLKTGDSSGSSSGALTIASGSSSSGSGNLTVQTGSGGIGNSGSISITTGSSGSAAAGNIQIDVGTSGAGTPQINIGTGADAATTIGKASNANTVLIQGGTGASAISLASGSGGTIKIGSSGVAGTIQLGNTTGAVAQTINIGNNATASSTSTVTIGSTIGTSPVTIQSGTSGVLVKGANTTTAFQVQNASGTSLLTADTTNLTVTVSGQTTTSTFAAKVDLTAGTAPWGVATGDFNGDGKTDAIVSNNTANTASVYINSGSALPSIATSTLTTGTGPREIAAGDFNGDGKTDAIITNFTSNTASVYINTGSALPTTATSTLTAGAGPWDVATGDFNGDGKTDAIITNFTSNTASVYINTGSALPTTATSTLTAGAAREVAIGDFNRDGKTDAIIVTANTTDVSVYINTGSALPTTATYALTPGGAPWGVATGDFNGDGKPDAAVTNFIANTTSVYINTGSALPTSATYTLTAGTANIATGDFNGDGRIDAAVAAGISVYINTGSALPTSATSTLTAGSAVGSGDFNGDGKLDIISVTSGSNIASVFTNTTPNALAVNGITNHTGSLTVSGSSLFKNTADSQNAFQIQNANGASLFAVDNLNSNISLGNAGLAGTIQIGNTNGAFVQTINIGNNATASSLTNVTIGSTIGASQTLLQSGTSGVLVKGANTTTAFQVQNASGTSLLTVDTTNGYVAVGPGAVAANSVLTVGANSTFASGGIAFGSDTVSNSISDFVTASNPTEAVAYDSNYIYWTDSSGAIGRANLDGTNVNNSFITGLPFAAQGIAVDSNFIYYAMVSGNEIGRANLDGTGVNNTFITGANGPRGVVVDGSFVYWTNNVGNTIGRATIAGGSVNQSFITGASGPWQITVDPSNIYWANRNSNAIGRATLAGGSVNQSIVSGMTDLIGVAVDGTYIYWGDYAGNRIGRANLDGSNPNLTYLSSNTPRQMAVNSSYIYWARNVANTVARYSVNGATASAINLYRTTSNTLKTNSKLQIQVNSGTAFQVQNSGGISLLAVDTINAATILGSAGTAGLLQTQAGTTSTALTLQSGGATAGASGAVNLKSGAGTTSTGGVTIQSGNASAGTSGTITIDNGTATSGTPTINIGATNALAVNIGNGTGASAVSVLCGTGTCGFGNNGVAHTTTVGSVTGAATTNIQGGTGGIAIGNNGVANTIQIGNTTGAVAQTINIGNNATASSQTTLNIGSAVGTSPVTIASGTSGITASSTATTGTGFSFADNSLTTGNELQVTSTSTALTSGNLVSIGQTSAYTSGATISGNALTVSRSNSITASAPSFDAGSQVTSYSATGGTNTISSYTVSAGHTLVVYVSTQLGFGGATSVKFNTTLDLIKVAETTDSAACGGVGCTTSQIWMLPSSNITSNTTASITITRFNSTQAQYAAAATFSNADPITPYGTAVTNTGSSATASVSGASTGANEVLLSVASDYQPTVGYAAGSGESVVSNSFTSGSLGIGAGYKAAATSASWNSTNPYNWTIVAVPLKPAGLTVTGAVSSLASNCTPTSGTCTDSANILNLNQQYSSATGSVLKIQNAGTGNDLELGAGRVLSGVANSGSAIAFKLNTASFTSAGAKLLSVQNNSVEKFSVDKDGSISIAGSTITSSGALSIDAGGTNTITLGTASSAHTTTVGSTNSTSNTNIQSGSGGIALTSTLATGATPAFGFIDNSLATANGLQVTSTSSALTAGNLLSASQTSSYTSQSTITNNILNLSRSLTSNISNNVQVDTSTGSASSSYSINVGNNSNRLLMIVIVAQSLSSAGYPSSVTLNGSATGVNTVAAGFWSGSSGWTVSTFYVKQANLPTGSNTLAYTCPSTGSAGNPFCASAMVSLYNVDQTTSIGTPSTNTGTSTAPTTASTTANSGDMVLSLLGTYGNDSVTAGQTFVASGMTGGSNAGAYISRTTASGNTTMNWTETSSAPWAIAGIAVKAVQTGITSSGAVANISNTCLASANNFCTDSSNVLNLNQQYASATGAVLALQNAGSGAAISLTQTGSSTIDIQLAKGLLQTAAGTTSNAVTLQSGNASAGASGAAILQSGSGTTGTGAITIKSGNASAGASGNITIDTGTFTSGTPTISIGTANSAAITIGRTGITTTIFGSLVVQAVTFNQSITLNGHLTTGNTSGSTSAAPHANAGTSATCTVSGNDTGGQITLVTGSASWVAGTQCTITFANSYATVAPHPVITSANGTDTSAVKPYVDVPGSTPFTTWTLNFINADTGARTYKFNYFLAQ